MKKAKMTTKYLNRPWRRWNRKKHIIGQRRDLLAFAAELYGFVVNELDSMPAPPGSYVTSPEAQRASRLVEAVAVRRGLVESISHRRGRRMNFEGEIAWLKSWAAEQKCALQLEGEVGFGRECVGITFGNQYVDMFLDWRDPGYDANHATMRAFVYPPKGVDHAYHKHDCLAVLGRGNARVHELFLWVKKLAENNITVKVIDRPRPDNVIELALHGLTYAVLAKED